MSVSILLTPDNNYKCLKRSLYHISRFTNFLLEQKQEFELVVVDDGTCDINAEVEAFSVRYFWKTIRPHYNSIEEVGFKKLYENPQYTERMGYEYCKFDKIIKVSGNVIPFQDTLKKLYAFEKFDGWKLANVYGIEPIIESSIDLYGIIFPKNTVEACAKNFLQNSNYIKYKRPIFGIVNKENFWSDQFSVEEDIYALSSQNGSFIENTEIDEQKLDVLKNKIEIFTNIQ